MNSYGAADNASRRARLSHVSRYRSESKMLYSAETGVRRNFPTCGRFTPDDSDGRSIARTLKSPLRDLNGSTANNAPTSRFTSAWNFGSSEEVYPSPRTSRSTFSVAGPFSKTVQTAPLGARSAAFTNRDDGSIEVVHTSRNNPSPSRR